ncbi:hypothetical protein V1525DRAFT_431379 [Lipomyces kononenkoae]|uniref:Uncharacterized protein n=1 Tax=Lipomyces kononenkoae TaxID=34357 RepID=A0ACC3T4K8_LIPKO
MAFTTPPLAAVSPSLFPHTPTSPNRTNIAPPTLDPAYISAEAAAAVLASDALVQAHSVSVLPPTPDALEALNGFLDYLVLILLFRAKSSLIDPLRNAVKQIFKCQLGRDAIAEGEAELRAYIRTPEEEYALLGTAATTTSPDSAFDTELAWRMARVRCMVYSSLGNVDESDVLKYTPEQRSLFSATESLDPSDLISPIATIFLTTILEFVAEYALLVAGRAALSSYLVASRSRPQLATGVLLLEEADVDKLALDPQVGKVWRQWKKKSHEFALTTVIQSPSANSLLTQTPEQTQIIQTGSDEAQVLAQDATDIFKDAITASSTENKKKVRPISVDNGMLSLEAYDNEPSQDGEFDEPTRQLGERSIPVTLAIIEERRKSRPWSFHGQRFSLYESFAALTGSPFSSPTSAARPETAKEVEFTVPEGIDEEDSAQVSRQIMDGLGGQPSSSVPVTSGTNLTRQLLPEAFDTAHQAQKLETEQAMMTDSDVSVDPVPNGSTSDAQPTYPTSSYFNKSKTGNDIYEAQQQVEEASSYDYNLDNRESLNSTIDDDDDRNRYRRQSSANALENKSNADNDVPVVILASAPPTGHSRAYLSEEQRPDALSSTTSKRLSGSGFSTKMKGKNSTPTSEATIPGFGTTVPAEKVRKYVWISNQKFDDKSGSSGISTSIKGGDSPELEHVTFERLLQSDITYKLNLTPDRLREPKPFYGTNQTRVSVADERSNSASLRRPSSSGSGASIKQTSQSRSELPPSTRSSSSGSISSGLASQQAVARNASTSRLSTFRRLQENSMSASHVPRSSSDDRRPVGESSSLPHVANASSQPLKHVRNESVKAAAGATHELMNLLRLSSSREDLKDRNTNPKTYARNLTEGNTGEMYHHTQALQKSNVQRSPAPEISERHKQSRTPVQSTGQVRRSPSIMNRLGFSGVVSGAAKTENAPPLPSTSSTDPVYGNHGMNSPRSMSNSSRTSSSSSLVGGLSGIGIPRPANNMSYKTARDELRTEQNSGSEDLANFLRTTGPDESPRHVSSENISRLGSSKPAKTRRSSVPSKTGSKGLFNGLPKTDRKKGMRFLGFLKGDKHVAV